MLGPGELSSREPRPLGTPLAKIRAGWLDVACVAILALSCVLLRAGTLRHATLNPDESQYQATASYLAGTGQSPLAYDLGSPATYWLFTFVHRAFGPYAIVPVRLLVLGICLALALMLFELVRRETNRVCGLAAGMAFLHYSMLSEGLTVNSEWFAVAMTATGLCLWLAVLDRSGTAAQGVRFLAGLATALALWFKLHAVFTVLAVPLAMVFDAVARREPREGTRRLLAFVAGGAAGGAIHLLPYWFAGNLGVYLGDVLGDWRVYVRGNEEVVRTASGGTLGVYVHGLFTDLPHRPLLLAAYGFAVLSAVQATRFALRPHGPRPFAARTSVVACAAWLVTSVATIQLGHRFFTHYYLLMVVPVAALVGFALGWLWREAPRRTSYALFALAFFLALVLDAGLHLRGAVPAALQLESPRTVLFLIYAACTAGLAIRLALRPLERAPHVAALGLALHVLLVVAIQQSVPTPRPMGHHPYRFDELVAWLGRESRPGDRLFVWGWAPEIYALTRLEAASRLVTSEYVVRDFPAAVGRPNIDPAWAERMMSDLRTREPRFIVDAGERSWTSTDARFYRLELYPGFELVELLARHYVARARVDGCVIYERVGLAGSTRR